MQRRTTYELVKFTEWLIQQAVSLAQRKAEAGSTTLYQHMSTTDVSGTAWQHDDLHEWLSDYRKPGTTDATLTVMWARPNGFTLSLTGWPPSPIGLSYSSVEVTAPTRGEVEQFFSIFEPHVHELQVARPEPVPLEVPQHLRAPLLESHGPQPRKLKPVVFIGHGRSTAWNGLANHLRTHGYEVEAYETVSRAGETIRDALSDMLGKSTFAVLVMTAEDESGGGRMRARQNVVHEMGLFQGRLGFSKAIAVVESGVEEFSNLAGFQQVRYSHDIREAYGEVAAAIKKAFGV